MFDRETAQLEYPGAQSETAVLAKADFETQETTAVENGPQIVSVSRSKWAQGASLGKEAIIRPVQGHNGM
jgi:hypothetical protein